MPAWAVPSIRIRPRSPPEVTGAMHPPYSRAVHAAALLPGMPQAALLERTELGVNSHHYQAIKVLAPGFAETARSEDGLAEAVCLPDKSFVWAVQWHPVLFFPTLFVWVKIQLSRLSYAAPYIG